MEHMKVTVSITQKTVYMNYKDELDDYSDTLHLEFDSLEAAKSAVDSFPADSVADLNASIEVILKDYDKRNPAEISKSEPAETSEDGDSE